MTDEVTSLESKENTEQKVGSFLVRNRISILVCVAVIIVAAIAVSVFFGVKDGNTRKSLSKIDSIENTYRKDGSSLSSEEILARQTTALEGLDSYRAKSGVVGARSNLLAADIYFSKKDYTSALEAYESCMKADKKSYTYSISLYNSAVCYEELGNSDEALSAFEKVSEVENFPMVPQALFNMGLIKESKNDSAGAVEIYKKIADTYTSDSYANLAQSRLLALEVAGKN